MTLNTPLNTVPGQVYTIQLWYASSPGFFSGSSFEVEWNGEKIGAGIYDDPSTPWTQLTYTTPPASGQDSLNFHGGSLGYWYIDDIVIF